MDLRETILKCKQYEDTEEMLHTVYVKKIDEKFNPNSDVVVLVLSPEEMEMNVREIAKAKCPGYDYFLEMFILQDMYDDMLKLDEYKSDDKKVERIIYYAEFDA